MNPVLKLWYYYNWIGDKEQQQEIARDHAYLTGSFIDPAAVKALTDQENKHVSTDEEFEESFKMVQQYNNIKLGNKPRRTRPKRD